MIDFAGQVVIVTGAGRGLGRLHALELARRGASVVAFISATERFIIPGSIYDEVASICTLLGLTS